MISTRGGKKEEEKLTFIILGLHEELHDLGEVRGGNLGLLPESNKGEVLTLVSKLHVLADLEAVECGNNVTLLTDCGHHGLGVQGEGGGGNNQTRILDQW